MRIQNNVLIYPRGIVGNNIYLFTANSTIKKNGRLTMGRGCAQSARDTYLGIDKKFGSCIDHMSSYGLKIVKWHEQYIGAFQTKIDWQDATPVDLLIFSTDCLCKVANQYKNYTFHLPYPAISNGHLTEEIVEPIIEHLPDNVIIYKG